MEVAIDKRYPIAASIAQAWTVLSDIRATAGCMPGASITEQIDDTHFKGAVKSKVGPATMTFGGDIEVLGIDAADHRLHMLGKGSDKTGSSASMDLTATLEIGEAAGSCVLVGHAAIIVNGKLAQFGSRLLVPVADMMLGQFAKTFEAAASAVQMPISAAEAPAALLQVDVTSADVAPAEPMPVSRNLASAVPSMFRPAKELNVMAFGWALFKSWLGGLFGKHA